MNIYTEKGLERWVVFCSGCLAVFCVVMAILAVRATFG